MSIEKLEYKVLVGPNPGILDAMIAAQVKINEIIEAVNQLVINSKPPELQQAYYADQEKTNHKCICLACKPLKREQNV